MGMLSPCIRVIARLRYSVLNSRSNIYVGNSDCRKIFSLWEMDCKVEKKL